MYPAWFIRPRKGTQSLYDPRPSNCILDNQIAGQLPQSASLHTATAGEVLQAKFQAWVDRASALPAHSLLLTCRDLLSGAEQGPAGRSHQLRIRVFKKPRQNGKCSSTTAGERRKSWWYRPFAFKPLRKAIANGRPIIWKRRTAIRVEFTNSGFAHVR